MLKAEPSVIEAKSSIEEGKQELLVRPQPVQRRLEKQHISPEHNSVLLRARPVKEVAWEQAVRLELQNIAESSRQPSAPVLESEPKAKVVTFKKLMTQKKPAATRKESTDRHIAARVEVAAPEKSTAANRVAPKNFAQQKIPNVEHVLLPIRPAKILRSVEQKSEPLGLVTEIDNHPGSSENIGPLELVKQNLPEARTHTPDTVDLEIQEILSLEPNVTLEELVARAGESEELTGVTTSETPNEEPEKKNVFIELQEYVELLKAVEPAKAEVLQPLLAEISQIAEQLVELQGLHEVDEVIKTEAEATEEQVYIEMIEARLKVVCVKLLEAMDIEPTEEMVMQFVQEFLAATHDDAQKAQLSVEELAKRGTHEYKLQDWFSKFRQLLDDSTPKIQGLGRLALSIA